MLVRVQGVKQNQTRVDGLRCNPVSGLRHADRGSWEILALRRVASHDAAVVNSPCKKPEENAAENTRHRTAGDNGKQDREAVEDRELDQEQRNGPPVHKVPNPGPHAKRKPGQRDKEDQLKADESQDTEVLAKQQLPAGDRLGKQDRRGTW